MGFRELICEAMPGELCIIIYADRNTLGKGTGWFVTVVKKISESRYTYMHRDPHIEGPFPAKSKAISVAMGLSDKFGMEYVGEFSFVMMKPVFGRSYKDVGHFVPV